MSAIVCKGLSRRYGDVDALKPLDLEVPEGSVFGFLGRNGAGKTTTIRLLTGLARPSSGRAWVAGILSTDGDESARRHFGYLPEEPAFYGWMTPREFLDHVAKIFGIDKEVRLRRISELLELTSLDEAANRRIGGFSRGMRQRLGLAQALIHQPPVLFLDEPTSALDPAGRKAALDLIEKLRGTTTVFLSSHILADVERVCDTVGVIHEGELMLVEGRDRLLSQYTRNNVVIEVDSELDSRIDDFVTALKQQPWLTEVIVKDEVIHISVSDVDQAKMQLIPLISESKLVLSRYEWIRPNLEDIFLSISSI